MDDQSGVTKIDAARVWNDLRLAWENGGEDPFLWIETRFAVLFAPETSSEELSPEARRVYYELCWLLVDGVCQPPEEADQAAQWLQALFLGLARHARNALARNLHNLLVRTILRRLYKEVMDLRRGETAAAALLVDLPVQYYDSILDVDQRIDFIDTLGDLLRAEPKVYQTPFNEDMLVIHKNLGLKRLERVRKLVDNH
jgi:hypothetical protein